jgi:hypothetical protein
MTTFNYEALWNKSKIFVDRAIRARDHDNPTEFHLWAAISLELLGKAALSFIHPTLVADPNDIDSLLTAAGRPVGTTRRSIPAGTLFDRLSKVVPDFEDRMKRECMLMANRRNAELHSGESPIDGLDQRSWVPAFWRAAAVLLAHQEKSLTDWLGESEASRVASVLRDTAELTRQTVEARIERRRDDFERRFPSGSSERKLAESRANSRPLPPNLLNAADAFEDVTCPSCGTRGWLLGSVGNEEYVEAEYEDSDWGPITFQCLRTTYDVEAFHCPECSLKLEGRDEIAIAHLPADFVREEEQQPDYEPDYGND